MKLLKTSYVLAVIILSSSLHTLAEDRPLGPGKSSDIDRIFAEQGANSPVTLLLRAHLSEQDGNAQEALKIYKEVLEQWPSESKWGRLANLRMARCLLCKRPAEPAAAKEILSEVQLFAGNPVFQRERQLWQISVELHEMAEKWLQHGPVAFDDIPDKSIADWKIPSRLLRDFSRSMVSVSDRFLLQGKMDAGCDFLHELFIHLANKHLQNTILRELISMQLQANRAADALISTRAYWLISVEKPELLPDAIEQTLRCMKALGASDTQMEQYRLLQMYGDRVRSDDGTIDRNPLDGFLSKYASDRILIPPSVIQQQATLFGKARLYLLNGEITQALPLIKSMVETTDGQASLKEKGIGLARMALALHDGHIHAIERYEQYLYQQASKQTGQGGVTGLIDNPLEELVKGAGKNEAASD